MIMLRSVSSFLICILGELPFSPVYYVIRLLQTSIDL